MSSITLVFITNEYTMVGYNLIFAFFLQFIMVAEEVQTLKFTNIDVINGSNRAETYVFLEIFLVISIGAETINLIKFNKEQETNIL